MKRKAAKSKFFAALTCLLLFTCLAAPARAAAVSDQIVVDQIGYRVNADKWFMIKNPITGYDSAITYVPGATVQLRRTSDNAVMQTITLSQWNGGLEDTTFSGDIVWQGNFTSFNTPGTYHIYDTTNGYKSYDFEIADNVFNGALAASVKSYFYNRSNIQITATHGGTWTHAFDHTQQLTARLYDASLGGDQGAGTARDITKGWFDAGDYRKYTAWMSPVIWDLAYAYEWYPDRFSDSTAIPESGNGVPDILDEIKWEIDWLLKMQRADGALYSGCFVVTGINGTSGGDGNPAADDRPYFYANFSTAATASGATAFAIGARLFAPYNSAYPGYAATLQTAATNAWNFLQANPNNIQYNHTNFDNANANQNDGSDKRMRFMAAAELYRATGNTVYRTYCDANYNNANTADGTYQPITSNSFMPGAGDTMKRGLVSYAMAAGATAAVVTAIKTSVSNGADWYITSNLVNCPYRSFMWEGHYTWGSNGMKADWGNIAMYAVALNAAPANNTAYRAAAEEYLHYFHGRNATAYCYLSQSQLFGAGKSITQFFHSWFGDGTVWDTNPAPGFLTGGPNQFYSVASVSPPYGQPPMKSYLDWNKVWPDSSWEVTENSTGYQSRHVLLNAAFAGPAGPTPTFTCTPSITPNFTHTFTPTRTRTSTNTPFFSPTNTPTQTPIPPYLLIYDGDTAPHRLADGTVFQDADSSMTEVAGGTPGNAMLNTYPASADWWAQNEWEPPSVVNIGTNTNIVFEVRANSGTVENFMCRLLWYYPFVNVENYVAGGAIDGTWRTASIPIVDMLDTTTTSFSVITFISNWNLAYGVMVDNIRLEGSAASPTFTVTGTASRVPSTTYTASRTGTHTPTATRTGTPTSTRTNSPVNTQTFTPTYSRTSTQTATASNTSVITATYTGSMTITMTRTPVITPTFTATRTTTGTNSPSPTGTYTATGTATRTETPSFTATYTRTGTPSATRTSTPSRTATSTFTDTPVYSPTETITGTPPTETGTPTATLTSTATGTHTGTRTYTPTASPTSTRTPSVTPTDTCGCEIQIVVTVTPGVVCAGQDVTIRVGIESMPNVDMYDGSISISISGVPFTYVSTPAAVTISPLPKWSFTYFEYVIMVNGTGTLTVRADGQARDANPVWFSDYMQTTAVVSACSPTFTLTSTPTGTPQIFSPTVTQTATRTQTAQDTATQTSTALPSMTNTPANTVTATYSAVPSSTDTPYPTSTASPSVTRTATPSVTLTQGTATITRTPTTCVACLPTPDTGSVSILDVTVFPNPVQYDGGGLNFMVQFDPNYDYPSAITLYIYTASFRSIRKKTWDTLVPGHTSYVAMDEYELGLLANGVYYCVIQAENNGGNKSNKKVLPFIILKE